MILPAERVLMAQAMRQRDHDGLNRLVAHIALHCDEYRLERALRTELDCLAPDTRAWWLAPCTQPGCTCARAVWR